MRVVGLDSWFSSRGGGLDLDVGGEAINTGAAMKSKVAKEVSAGEYLRDAVVGDEIWASALQFSLGARHFTASFEDLAVLFNAWDGRRGVRSIIHSSAGS